MPLEKFFSGEQPINVKDLTIENPEKEEDVPFDPEKEMTSDDWERIKKFLKTRTLEISASLAAMLMQAYPEKAKEFGAEAMARKLNEEGERFLEKVEDGSISSQVLYGMKILTPELFQKLATPERMERCIEWILDNPWHSFSHTAFIMKTLVPQEKINDASKKIWELVQEDVKELKARGRWDVFMRHAMSARLLFPPEKFAELGIDNETLKNMKKEFQETREESHRSPSLWKRRSILNEAVNLKIIAAEEIKFAEDGGIEIIMRKPKSELQSETPSMPEKRNF